MTKIHDYVEAIQIPPNPDDNATPYPCENTHDAGMALEFRCVRLTKLALNEADVA
jgi:hypothetical protein